MHLFADYLQPLTVWLHVHPTWALLFTFLISLSESLAIIGTLVPGSVTMTAIGILAGSGVMRIDLTFCAAILGAVAGDSASYALGYTFSDRLAQIWPFRRYPKLLNLGKAYFNQHGGKSVLIGRFVGPLRSIIPVIAGMMRMRRWHFFLANFASAIGWSILFVTPGVLIGAASSELSSESATRLFSLILMLLAIVWLASLGIKWLFLRLNKWVRINIYAVWIWSKRHPIVTHLLKSLSPVHNKNHYPTVALLVLFIACFISSILITVLVIQGTWIATINNPVSLFLQSLRTQSFDKFFIISSFMISPISQAGLLLTIALSALLYRDWRLLRYWLSLGLTCGMITCLLSSTVPLSNPANLLNNPATATFPAISLTVASALFGFLIFYVNTQYRWIIALTLRVVFLMGLALAGISSIYLGDNWMTSILGAYLIGFTLSLLHWIFYRRKNEQHHQPQLAIVLSCLILIVTSGVEYALHYRKLIHDHDPYSQQYVVTHKAWWYQNQPLLPVYTVDRIGQRSGLFNIQYAGSVNRLERSLSAHGWKKQSDSFFHSLLLRAGGHNTAKELPLMAQLYLNINPVLIMTYHANHEPGLYILRLWQSNYHLQNYRQPIWIGSIIHSRAKFKIAHATHGNLGLNQSTLFTHILPALDGFTYTHIARPDLHLKALAYPAAPDLLIIKETDEDKL